MGSKAPRQSSRRRFLLRSARASLTLPVLESLGLGVVGSGLAVGRESGAAAESGKLVAIGNLLGYYQPNFIPEKAGREFTPPPLLEPLQGHREQLTIYSGLDHGVKGGHFAVHSFLSGVLSMDAKGRPDGNISLDQLAAEHVGGATRFPSLTVGSESGIHGGCQMCWTRSGTRVPPITGARELFRQLFVNDSAKEIAGAKDRVAMKGSILDTVREDARSLERRIDRADRDKLEEYLTSVREVEQRLELRRRWAEVPKPEPPLPEPKNRNMVDDLPLLYDLIALALQTGSTRIATLEIGGDFESRYFDIQKGYHSLSHHGKDPENIRHLLVLETYQMEQFARFLGKLKSIQDGEGNLLDHTTVLFGSGMANANAHTNRNLPVILAGGGFRHGEHRVVGAEESRRTPLCNLYLSLLQNLGVEVERFGTSTGTFI